MRSQYYKSSGCTLAVPEPAVLEPAIPQDVQGIAGAPFMVPDRDVFPITPLTDINNKCRTFDCAWRFHSTPAFAVTEGFIASTVSRGDRFMDGIPIQAVDDSRFFTGGGNRNWDAITVDACRTRITCSQQDDTKNNLERDS
jgi:hypothetical protein